MYDLVVIGAGWYGLGAARAYIELHPNHEVLVLEAADTCGGAWGRDRLYPGLKSNCLFGTYEFPNFPMSEEVYGVKQYEHIPASIVHQYLTDFSEHFGIAKRTRYGVRVDKVEAIDKDNTWKLYTTGSSDSTFSTKKLIIATGLTSNPNLPTYKGSSSFTPPLFHAKYFYTHRGLVEKCQSVTVIGCGKSAYDVSYAFATSKPNTTVDLIIRPSGQGPVWLAPAFVTPLKRSLEGLVSTRFFSWMSPAPWQDSDGHTWAHWFLQQTPIGRLINEKFWTTISDEVIETHGLDKHPEVRKLKPWNSAKWTGSALGIHTFPTNFFDLVREGKIRIHIAEVDHLNKSSVHLTDGTALQTEAVICATGWKKASEIEFLNYDPALPISPSELSHLSASAEQQILTRFPTLRAQPSTISEVKRADPPRLYRFMVPASSLQHRNIAYAGMVTSVNTCIHASVQALWISAFFDGADLHIPSTLEEAVRECILHASFEKLRWPCGYGASIPDFAFDGILYADLLMADLGLRTHRKEGWLGGVRDLFEPYVPRDYDGVLEEWRVRARESGLGNGGRE